MSKRYLALCLAFVAGLSLPVWAQTDADRASVAALINSATEDTLSGDMAGVMETMPPAIFEAMGESVGMSADDIRTLAMEQIESATHLVEFETVHMDLENARSGVSATGRPYFLISTEVIMAVRGSGRIRGVSDTLALHDNGEWWLLRVESPTHRQWVADTFPDLANLPFALGVMEPLP